LRISNVQGIFAEVKKISIILPKWGFLRKPDSKSLFSGIINGATPNFERMCIFRKKS
jgi:hypothetical protein